MLVFLPLFPPEIPLFFFPPPLLPHDYFQPFRRNIRPYTGFSKRFHVFFLDEEEGRFHRRSQILSSIFVAKFLLFQFFTQFFYFSIMFLFVLIDRCFTIENFVCETCSRNSLKYFSSFWKHSRVSFFFFFGDSIVSRQHFDRILLYFCSIISIVGGD